MKYYILAGEASGDLHGSRLIRQLKRLDARATILAWGGDLMSKAGATLRKHYGELAFMGFAEVLLNLRSIFKNFEFAKKDILNFRPDAIIFIDYPGFNLRMATWAKSQGFKTFYYISPQLWAWKENRVKIIKTSIDQLYTILPFESDFYKKHAVDIEYVGHPLLEAIQEFTPDMESQKTLQGKRIIALLPGSRKQEVKRMLPIFLQAAQKLPDYLPVIAAAPSLSIEFYQNVINQSGVNLQPLILQNKTYTILKNATLAWVSSGTATLETALFGVPQVVCYTGHVLSYHIAKRLVKIKFISLVNLILNKKVIPELIQHDFSVVSLIQTTNELDLQSMQEEYKKLHQLLLPDNASFRVATSILEKIKKS